ncbi:MAG: GGDEF domain-containing protein [Gammaproteobacteria bacterium]|nr:GGDEF domain-containing protein [Gammaproteobacteria bacterium]
MDYISHLDAINPEADNMLAAWSQYASLNNEADRLIEQLQTTLDVEQILGIYLGAIANHFKINTVELDTFHGKFEATNGHKSKQSITLPIRIHDRLMGRITYFSDRAITDVLMSSLANYQKKLVYPLRNGLAFWQLHQMAMKDPLTGIGNRAMFDDTMARQIQHAVRFEESFVLMLLDLDNFKQVNDNHGHLVGDDILTRFVNISNDCLRGTDQMFRFGGDEFAIILEKENLETAKMVAARINRAVNKDHMLTKYGVSVSIGCAASNESEAPTDLFAKADKALYAAKDAGKNCMKTA